MEPATEFELIRRLAEGLPEAGGQVKVGLWDDAAVVERGGATVITVDAVVEGVHFRRDTFPLAAIGHKALAAALSDIAAMGAAPGEAYVVLGVPSELSLDDCVEVYRGLGALAERTGTSIAGGDVTRSPTLFLSLTAVGHAESADAVVRRTGAGAGDVVVVTGALGGAAAGLALLEGRASGDSLGTSVRDALVARQHSPEPRLAAGRALAGAGATAMIDVSDGIGADAVHLARAGRVAIRIELERLPLDGGVAELAAAAGLDPFDLASGGEDYELLACLPPERLEAASASVRQAGSELTAIGEVGAGEGVALIDADGSRRKPGGFDQLRGSG